MRRLVPIAMLFLAFIACGQKAKKEKADAEKAAKKIKSDNNLNNKTMDLSIISNDAVRGAVEGMQNKDKQAWKSHFTDDAKMTDDGNPRDLDSFTQNAIGDEWFTDIHRVENNGKDVYGHLVTKQWGEFDVYFKFKVNDEGKIHQVDFGQMSKL